MAKPSAAVSAITLVTPYEGAFLSRWRLSTLQRLNADLHDRLREQRSLYDAAMLTGTDADIREHSEAMVRGWQAACAALEAAEPPHDAYQVGKDRKSGLTVIIADTKRSLDAARPFHPDAVFMSPDEVAVLLAGQGVVASIKGAFTHSEIIATEPAQ